MTAVIVDVDRLDANVRRFHRTISASGIRVRAHTKAHRTTEVARRQVEAGAPPTYSPAAPSRGPRRCPLIRWPAPGRLAPAHICPLTETLVRRGIPFTAVAGGRRVGSGLPFAASDR